MRRLVVSIGLALALTGCGRGSEDFTVQVARSPADVMALLSQVDINDASIVISGIKLKISRPNAGELLFSMPTSKYPGDKGENSEILIRFEPVSDGKGTVLHVAVDVPPVPVLMGEPNMVLSEKKVEKELRKVLVSFGKNLSERKDTGADKEELRKLLFALAVTSDSGLQAQANQLKNDPDRLEGLVDDAFADSAEVDGPPVEQGAAVEAPESWAKEDDLADEPEAESAYYDPVDEQEPTFE
jgi:hypothetical protein